MTENLKPPVRPVLMSRRRDIARAGVVMIAALVLILSAAATNGAAPSAGANPSVPAASAKIERDGGNRDKSDRGLGSKLRDLRIPGVGPVKGDNAERGGRQITITSISGSNVSLKTNDGWTRTVAVTGSTKVFVGSQEGNLGSLKVGDRIRLRQQRNADGTFTVSALIVEAPTASGSVTSLGVDAITVKRRDGSSTTIALNGATKFQVGKANATKSDVHVGSRIVAEGTGSPDKLLATVVRIQPTVASGTVTAKTATSLTIKVRDGSSLTIHVDAATAYRVRGAATKPASLADIKVGDRILVAGTPRTDKSLDAFVVGAASAKATK